MKVCELFEAKRPEHLGFVKDKLKELKSSLYDHDLSNEQIRRALNHAFEKFMITFVINPAGRESNYSRVGLGGAECDAGGHITIHLTDDVYDALNGGAYYEEFVDLCAASIAHELTHREQIMKHARNGENAKDPDRLRDYLEDHREIEAFAVQAAMELFSAFEAKDILAKLAKSSDLEYLAKYSDSLEMYLSVFNPPSSTLNRFLKKLHSVVSE